MTTATAEEPLEAEVLEVDAPQALDTITRAEIDMAIATAHRFPRNLSQFKDEVLTMACLDQDTAAQCFYAIRRGGNTIMGPSIRLAEIAAAAYGNIRAGARVMGESEDGKFVVAQGVCHDLQRNVYVSIEARRRITTKDGRKYNDDMIGTTANAAASVALRNAIYRVIPKALIKGAYERAIEVATGGKGTLQQKRENAMRKLQELSPLLTEERVLAVLERPSLDDVTANDLKVLAGLHTAITTGEATIDEAFPASGGATAEEILGEEEEEEKPAKPKKGRRPTTDELRKSSGEPR